MEELKLMQVRDRLANLQEKLADMTSCMAGMPTVFQEEYAISIVDQLNNRITNCFTMVNYLKDELTKI